MGLVDPFDQAVSDARDYLGQCESELSAAVAQADKDDAEDAANWEEVARLRLVVTEAARLNRDAKAEQKKMHDHIAENRAAREAEEKCQGFHRPLRGSGAFNGPEGCR